MMVYLYFTTVYYVYQIKSFFHFQDSFIHTYILFHVLPPDFKLSWDSQPSFLKTRFRHKNLRELFLGRKIVVNNGFVKIFFFFTIFDHFLSILCILNNFRESAKRWKNQGIAGGRYIDAQPRPRNDLWYAGKRETNNNKKSGKSSDHQQM